MTLSRHEFDSLAIEEYERPGRLALVQHSFAKPPINRFGWRPVFRECGHARPDVDVLILSKDHNTSH